jgi:hypothetical protein
MFLECSATSDGRRNLGPRLEIPYYCYARQAVQPVQNPPKTAALRYNSFRVRRPKARPREVSHNRTEEAMLRFRKAEMLLD